MLGPGVDDAPGPTHVAAPAARAWAIAAANTAVRVPATNAEAAAWTVRGWADVAIGCLALAGWARPGSGPDQSGAFGGLDCGAFGGLDCGAFGGLESGALGGLDSGAFGGLDEVVRTVPIISGGPHAARLRRVRELAGPVPPWYPDARPVPGPIRDLGPFAWQAADLMAGFGEELLMTGAGLPWRASCPLSSARQLAWGARYRPWPSEGYRTVRLPVTRFLARRTWMCLPGRPGPASGPGPVIAEVPSTAAPLAQQIWRGIHEGAHLDHLGALTAPGPAALGPVAPSPAGPAVLGPAAPSPAEFGAGLLIAESYAMAVEIVAAVECILAEEGHAVWQLGAGLIERATRLPGGSDPVPEFADLPTLAEVYVLGPLEVLAGGDAARALPEQINGSLSARWRSACTAYPPAAAFGSAAADLLDRSPRCIPDIY